MNRMYKGYTYTGRRNVGGPALSILFFPAVILYHELLLRAFDQGSDFFELALLPTLLFSAAAGLVLAVILDLLPWKTASRIIGGVVIGLGAALLCVERGCRSMFGLYYNVSFMGEMATDVAGGFASTVGQVVLGLIPFILLAYVPLAAYIFLRKLVVRDEGRGFPVQIILTAVLVACQLGGVLVCTLGPDKSYYTYDFTANTGIPHFGMVTALRLEAKYAIAGTPTPPLDDFLEDEPPVSLPSAEPAPVESGGPDKPRTLGPNQLDIDFEALAEAEEDETLQNMHQFFSRVTPSMQNEYTGLFEGKNLILITAEAFSTAAIDEELTPTLYKLSHEGFIFHNFYQPDWTQSTCGGEFAVTTGVIPSWIKSERGSLAAQASIDKYMPLTLAHLLEPLGYSVPAWHNHLYNYYDRDLYLTNFGYDYKGIGDGLELPTDVWPRSDLEMIQATADSYIDDYVDNGTPFHAYYMTVSGHGYYSWADNAMSAKHREEVQAKYPDLSETSQAYLACNMELDLALECLVDKLEAAGIADDTLIVMTGDHYPYLMIDEKTKADYYNELRGFTDTEKDTSRYRNTLVMWSGGIEEPIEVDTPCSSIDIVPTLCNLYGVEYDSRLYSGRDVFATNYEPDQYSNCMPLVIFPNKGFGSSWITAAGTYEASTKTFTPNEGIEVDEDYTARVSRLVSARVSYAKLILEEDYYRVLFETEE